MTKPVYGSEVSNDNYIPVDKDKLKEDQQKELLKLWTDMNMNASSHIVLTDMVKW